jgi:hypothetical protein
MKSTKDEKRLKLQNGLPTLWLGGETVNAVYIKKALAIFKPIFKPKKPGLFFQD